MGDLNRIVVGATSRIIIPVEAFTNRERSGAAGGLRS